MKKKTIYKVIVIVAITYLIAKVHSFESRMDWIEAQQDNVIETLITK
jgi:hypothetical protein